MKRPLLLAHRGFSGNYPENSPLAFRMAVEKTAADGFESDVHITKDGKLVIFHDASVERTSNGTGFIKDMTYDELLSLDIGAWKSPEFAGQHIWTFGQLLDFCKETKMLLNMELKNYEVFYENLEQRVIDEICKRQMQEQVFVSSFNHISMQHFKELCPDIETGLLYDKPYLDMEHYVQRSNADNMHPRYLKIAPVKVQFKALTKRADINRHLDTVRRELEHEQDPRCRVLQEDYLKLIRQLGSREAITRRFFLVFEYEPLPGTKRGHEEEDAIASLQTAARTAANYLRQCGNEVISPENEDDATAEILYNILCRRASSEPFYQRVKSVLADYMAAGRDINTIPVNEFYAPDSIDLIVCPQPCCNRIFICAADIQCLAFLNGFL